MNKNMNVQEKASELVLKFTPYMYCYIGSGMLSNEYDNKLVLESAQKCAIMLVDEILEVLNNQESNTKPITEFIY